MKKTNKVVALLGAIIALVALTACGEAKAYGSQCAFIIGEGGGDVREIKQIVYPNEKSDNLGDDIARYVPCNSRNYLVAARPENRDRETPSVARTGAAEGLPAREVKIFWSSFWTLNQNEEALRAFVPFCEKYNCYASEDEVSGEENFATAGWNGMLAENWGPSADRAFARAVTEFGPNLWNNRSEWPALAEKVSEFMVEELRTATGSDVPFFCGPGGNTRESIDQCAPPRFVVDSVQTVDGRAEAQQQATANVAGESGLNVTRRAEAERLYGSQADYWLGLQDALQKCKDSGQQCTVVVGGGAGVNVTPGTTP